MTEKRGPSFVYYKQIGKRHCVLFSMTGEIVYRRRHKYKAFEDVARLNFQAERWLEAVN